VLDEAVHHSDLRRPTFFVINYNVPNRI
jgi:hypothetical protein